MKTLTLEQLIEAAEICGSGKEGACQVCPAHNDGEVAELHGQKTFYVECRKCALATDRYARPQFAAEAWNRRTEGQLNE